MTFTLPCDRCGTPTPKGFGHFTTDTPDALRVCGDCFDEIESATE